MHKGEAVEQTTFRRLSFNKILLKYSELKEHVKGVEILQVVFIQASAEKNDIELLFFLTFSDSDPIHGSVEDYKFLKNLLNICSVNKIIRARK